MLSIVGKARTAAFSPGAAWKLANAWREGLVAAARERGEALTKNDARRQVAEAVDARLIDGRYLVELPGHTIEAVARALVGG